MLALVVTVTVGGADVELAADRLWALGVVAVEEREGGSPGVVELWTSLGDDTEMVAGALAGYPWPWRLEVIDESVSETWREHARPTWIADDVVVVPAWIDHAGRVGRAGRAGRVGRVDVDRTDVIAISIEPGATFGMGDHPTTVLSMRALRAVVAAGSHVLDVGCGSGILAIAAVKFGAARVDAIDISAASVPTTMNNARANGCTVAIAVSTTPLADVHGTYGIVVANILAPALIEMADDLQRVLADSGALVISGILAARHQHVLDALAPLRQIDRIDLDGWTAITLKR